jgi:aminoglycoside/choline kinase family phosphotransferase
MAKVRSLFSKKISTDHMPENDARYALLQGWLSRDLGMVPERIEPASSDASFRRYFRSYHAGATYIVMDAPPDKEDVRPYLKVTAILESLGAHAPRVYRADPALGFLLLEDLGGTHYLSRLNEGGDPQRLYGDALDILAEMQVRGQAPARDLPPYDREALAREMGLMRPWFLERHLGITLAPQDERMLKDAYEFLIAEALAQPKVFVHRDYHSRNLMVLPERNPGILDFQDALCGPIGYDLVSLLKDCYICWPRETVVRWVSEHRARLASLGGAIGRDETQFLRWFDLVGAQRHIKVLGIFARLWYRDGKPGYLKDLPLTLDYVRDTCERYPELAPLACFLEQQVHPRLAGANARVLAHAAAGAA